MIFVEMVLLKNKKRVDVVMDKSVHRYMKMLGMLDL